MPQKKPKLNYLDLDLINPRDSGHLIDEFIEFRSNRPGTLSRADKKLYAKQLIDQLQDEKNQTEYLKIKVDHPEKRVIFVSLRDTKLRLPRRKHQPSFSKFEVLYSGPGLSLLNPNKTEHLIDSVIEIYGPSDLELSEEEKQKHTAQLLLKLKNKKRADTDKYYEIPSNETIPRKLFVRFRKVVSVHSCNPKEKNQGQYRYHFYGSERDSQSGAQGDTFRDEVFGHIEDGRFIPRTETRNGHHKRRFKNIHLKPTLQHTVEDLRKQAKREAKYGRLLGLHSKDPIFYKKYNKKKKRHDHYALFVMRDFDDHITIAELIKKIKDGEINLNQTQYHIVMISIILALMDAHRQGILHRDLKPENIMINIDNLIDFEKGKIIPAQLIDAGYSIKESKSHLYIGLGNPGYIAPEVISGKISVLNDVYSIGVLLWSLLGGESLPKNHIKLVNTEECVNGREYYKSLQQLQDFSFPELPGATKTQLKLREKLIPIIMRMTKGDMTQRCQLSRVKLYLMDSLFLPLIDLMKRNENHFFYTKPKNTTICHRKVIEGLCKELYTLISGEKPAFNHIFLKVFKTAVIDYTASRISSAPTPSFLSSSSTRKKHRRRIGKSITSDILHLQKIFIGATPTHQAFLPELITSPEFTALQRYADTLMCESSSLLKQSGRQKSKSINTILKKLLQMNSWAEVDSCLSGTDLSKQIQALGKSRSLFSRWGDTPTSRVFLTNLQKRATTLQMSASDEHITSATIN